MVRCLIALGGNIGASESMFDAALTSLQRQGIEPIQLSRILKTRPVGADAGNEFLNAAATLETTLPAVDLLSVLHDVEIQFGRTRTIHWGPRTLDLDLVLLGDEIFDDPGLVVPHPAMWYRKFVLDPAMDVAADMVHPIQKRTLCELRSRLDDEPLRIHIRSNERRSDSLDLQCLCESLRSVASRIEWTVDDQWQLQDSADADDNRIFANVVLGNLQGRSSHRTQPSNSGFRQIGIYGDTRTAVLDQLVQLAAAICG